MQTDQVGSFVFRASWRWGAVLGAALVIRYVLDTFVPVADYRIRAATLSYTIIAICLLAGSSAAWRTRSIRSGVLISFVGATIGALLSAAGAGVLLAISHDPAALDRLRNSGGLREGFVDVPLKVIALGFALGSAGALIGKSIAMSLPQHVKKDT